MELKRLRVKNFRNLRDPEFCPCGGINLISGENAQGKTNLLESIWLFSGFKSFRGSKDREMIKFSENFLRNEVDFYSGGRNQNAKMIIADRKKIVLNGIPLKASSELVGNFNCVVFSPAHISLIKGGPSERRKFIDSAICKIKPSYAKTLNDYNKILDERNSLLKDLKQNRDNYEFLEIWNENLTNKCVLIVNERVKYLKSFSESAQEIYGGISGERENLSLSYKIKTGASCFRDLEGYVEKEEIKKLLKQSENNDILYGNTTIGAHKDDIDIKIDGLSSKYYASQGQQRSCALALKLAESEILGDITLEKPIALLDDVMSELDAKRQNYVLNHIKDRQVFITCCEPSSVLRMSGGKCFKMKNGILY